MFLANYRKRYATAKQDGEVNEQSADMMPVGVYRFLCDKAVAEGNSFLWTWLVTQWSLMCRSINVNGLLMEHIGVSGDAFTMRFPKTKCGQGGEQEHVKHVYANPLNPAVCPFLTFGVHCMRTADRHLGNTLLFQGKDQATRFNKQLLVFIKKFSNELESLGLTDAGARISTHSIRKGVGTFVASSPCGPSIVAICLRADWKLGSVLTVYLRLEKGGDQFVGRCASLLPLDKAEFGTMPPHFRNLEDPEVLEAAKEAFGDIWESHPHLHANLLLGLASIVYHRDFLRENFGSSLNGGCSLDSMSIFNDVDRLDRLAASVTTEQTTNMPSASGVPIHSTMLEHTSNILRSVNDLVRIFDPVKIAQKVAAEIDLLRDVDAERRGIITNTMLTKMFEDQCSELREFVGEAIATAVGPQQFDSPCAEIGDEEISAVKWSVFPNRLMQRHGQNGSPLYPTPDRFQMPAASSTLKEAWRFWIGGNPVQRVCPYRLLDKKSFGPSSKNLQKYGIDYQKQYPTEFDTYKRNLAVLAQLKAIMPIMEMGVSDVNLEDDMTAEMIELAWVQGLQYLKDNYISFAFDNTVQGRFLQYSFTSFAQWVKPFSIKTRGTVSDCRNLAVRIQNADNFDRTSLTIEQEAELAKLEAGIAPKAKKQRTC